MESITCEVCVETVDDAIRAEQAGADRIELCADLAVGGTTPSAGLIRSVVEEVAVPVMVMIRPRPGDFCFTDLEKSTMLRDVRYAAEFNAAGIVIGALTPDGEIDELTCRSLLKARASLDATFHRAFDLVCDPIRSVHSLINLGIRRILTSGQESTAQQGIPRIRQLVKEGGSQISVMPGAGVNEDNATTILRETLAKEIHFSGRQVNRETKDRFGFGERFITDGERVSAICWAVQQMSTK